MMTGGNNEDWKLAPQPESLKVYLVGELLEQAAEDGTRSTRPKVMGCFFADRDLAETWATFKNQNVTEDTITDRASITYMRGPRHRQDALEYFLRVGVFDDDATKRARDANRPYLITREDVLAGRVKV